MKCKDKSCRSVSKTEELTTCCAIPKAAKTVAETLGVEQAFIPINEDQDKDKMVYLTVTEECYKKFQKYCQANETTESVMQFYLESLEM